jgi:hypothetical protein
LLLYIGCLLETFIIKAYKPGEVVMRGYTISFLFGKGNTFG